MGSGSFGLSYIGGQSTGGTTSPLAIFDAASISGRFSSSMSPMGLVDYSLQIVDFKMEYFIPSFPESQFPDFKEYDSEATKASKRHRASASGGYFDMEISLRDANGGPWRGVSVVRLQNWGFIWEEGLLNPRMSSSDRFSLGSQTQIGIKFIDRGWGVPKAGDWINLSGSWVDDFKIYPYTYVPATNVIHGNGTISATDIYPRRIFYEDSKRRAFSIQLINPSEPGLFLAWGNISFSASGKQYVKDYGIRIEGGRELAFNSIDYTVPQALWCASASSISGEQTSYRVVELVVS